jgi:hypothetical protein
VRIHILFTSYTTCLTLPRPRGGRRLLASPPPRRASALRLRGRARQSGRRVSKGERGGGLALARLPRRRPPHTSSLASTTRSRGGRRICGRCTVLLAPRGPPPRGFRLSSRSRRSSTRARLGEGGASREGGQPRPVAGVTKEEVQVWREKAEWERRRAEEGKKRRERESGRVGTTTCWLGGRGDIKD